MCVRTFIMRRRKHGKYTRQPHGRNIGTKNRNAFKKRKSPIYRNINTFRKITIILLKTESDRIVRNRSV